MHVVTAGGPGHRPGSAHGRAPERERPAAWLSAPLELGLHVVVYGSLLAIGSVHPWAYVPLWGAAFLLALLAAARVTGWWQDRRAAGRPSAPPLPLLLPGLGYLGWGLLQLVPWPPGARAWTVSAPDTERGLLFVAAMLSVHLAAGVVFDSARARRRFRRGVAVFGALAAVYGLVQVSSRVKLIYGVFAPRDVHFDSFGPLVNRDHFAGYMLMVIPIAMGEVARALERLRSRATRWRTVRHRLLALGEPQAAAVVVAGAGVVATAGALIVTGSRGAVIALILALGWAFARSARVRGGHWAVPVLAGLVALALSWVGMGALQARFARAGEDAPGRLRVWEHALRHMGPYWLTGSGLDTFAVSMSSTRAWTLPAGAEPWPPEFTAGAGGAQGVRIPEGLGAGAWYREAHSDWVQVLVEGGVPGLLLALWAAGSALAAARRSPWVTAALLGVLLHVTVDFDLQIPAVAVLLVALAALGPAGGEGAEPAR